MSKKTITVESVTFKERAEASETLQINVLIDGEKKQVDMIFKYDPEGLIKSVVGSDVN